MLFIKRIDVLLYRLYLYKTYLPTCCNLMIVFHKCYVSALTCVDDTSFRALKSFVFCLQYIGIPIFMLMYVFKRETNHTNGFHSVITNKYI